MADAIRGECDRLSPNFEALGLVLSVDDTEIDSRCVRVANGDEVPVDLYVELDEPAQEQSGRCIEVTAFNLWHGGPKYEDELEASSDARELLGDWLTRARLRHDQRRP